MSLKELIELHSSLKTKDQESAHVLSDGILEELLYRVSRMVDNSTSDTIETILKEREEQSQKWWWA